jgi:hypothetical protein
LAALVVLLALLAAFLFGGCAGVQEYEALKGQISELRRSIQHEKTQLSKQHICYSISMEEWQREFGYDRELARAWAVICSKTPAVPVPEVK